MITTEYGVTTETVLEVVEGMSFDRGYLSHHMVTDPEKMEAVLDNPLILMTDLKIRTPEALATVRRIAEEEGRPLLIIAEEMAPEVVVTLLGKQGPGRYLVVHPPEYGHWRKAMLEDLAILTGGKVIARDLGGRIEDVTREDLGTAKRVQTTRVAYLDHPRRRRCRADRGPARPGAAPVQCGPAQHRAGQAARAAGQALRRHGRAACRRRDAGRAEADHPADRGCAARGRAAAEEGVVAGGGSALTQAAPALDRLLATVEGDVAEGVRLLRSVLSRPLARIAANAGADPDAVVAEVVRVNSGHGYNAAVGRFENMFQAGIVDPVRVTCSALVNAASVATLILTTETLIGDIAEDEDPTAGPARGGGAEKLGRQ